MVKVRYLLRAGLNAYLKCWDPGNIPYWLLLNVVFVGIFALFAILPMALLFSFDILIETSVMALLYILGFVLASLGMFWVAYYLQMHGWF